MKHCPLCNKSSEEARFFGEFCENCARERLTDALPKNVEVTVCRDCGKIKLKGAFVPESKATMEQLLQGEYKKYNVTLIHSGNGIARMCIIDERAGGVDADLNAHIKFIRTLCDFCSKKRASYYEAIVQLRGEQGKVTRMAEALTRYVEKNGSFITKTDEKEHGVDVYTGDKRVTQSFLSVRHLKWKGSYELHGQKGSKKLYRNTYFVTL